MKRTPLNKIGKYGKRNLQANAKLRKMFQDKGIVKCEVGLEGCCQELFTGFCHRHKRNYYYKHPELLYDFNEVILACQHCHEKLEYNSKLTEETFKRLRDYKNYARKIT